MSANNYILVDEDAEGIFTVAIKDADTGNEIEDDSVRSFSNLKNAVKYAQRLNDEYRVEYGITFGFKEDKKDTK